MLNVPLVTPPNCVVLASTCASSRTLPRVVVALLSLTALRNPDVSSARTTASSEWLELVRVTLSLAKEAVTPAADALIRARTVLIVSLALTAMLTPFTVKAPAVTCALPSKRGRALTLASLKTPLGSTSVLLWETVVAAVWLLVSDPVPKLSDRPMSSPR